MARRAMTVRESTVAESVSRLLQPWRKGVTNDSQGRTVVVPEPDRSWVPRFVFLRNGDGRWIGTAVDHETGQFSRWFRIETAADPNPADVAESIRRVIEIVEKAVRRETR